MQKMFPALLTLMLFLPLGTAAAPTSGAYPVFEVPTSIPKGARVTLELDKTQYFLGENILVRFRLENVDDKPFPYSYGSDYPTGEWNPRFKVSALGPGGHPVTAPAPGYEIIRSEQRPIREPILEPHQTVSWSLPLIRYCRFDKPGRYIVSIYHDLGWTQMPQRKFPVGEAVLNLKMPTPAQARQVIQEMDTLPAISPGRGKQNAPYPDFSALRYPVYLPLLRERARSNTPQEFETAVQGISSIPASAATLALLDLTNSSDPSHVLAAAQALNERLPAPPLSKSVLPQSSIKDPAIFHQPFLVRSAWRSQFAPLARACARRLLASPDPSAVVEGAFILKCIGTRDDFSTLMSALDTAIREKPPLHGYEGFYPYNYGTCAELERAMLARIQAGDKVPVAPQTPAEQDMYLQALTTQPSQYPPDWPTRCLSLLNSPAAYIRARTLGTLATLTPLPLPLSDTLRQRLASFLVEPNEDIQVAACEMALKIQDPALRAPALQALAQARDFPLPNNLTNVAVFQGARWEALKFWADHLDDPARKMDALGFLPRILDGNKNYGYNSNYDLATGGALKATWDVFLIAHRQEIQDGKTYTLETPEIQALFPRKVFVFGNGGW